MAKKKNIEKVLLEKSLGLQAREISLEKNPHGFARVLLVSKDKTKYSRKNFKNFKD